MSSTDNAITMKLKTLDRETTIVEKRLPPMRRFFRRYASGRMLVATQLFEHYGMLKGYLIASGKSIGTAIVAWIAVAWDHVETFFLGAVEAIVHTQ